MNLLVGFEIWVPEKSKTSKLFVTGGNACRRPLYRLEYHYTGSNIRAMPTAVITEAKSVEREGDPAGPKSRHQPPPRRFWEKTAQILRGKTAFIALLALTAIVLHLLLRFAFRTSVLMAQLPQLPPHR